VTDQAPATAPVTAPDTPGGPGWQPDAPEAPQTALQRLQRLRAQLAAEHAKAVAADQHPRPDLDHLRVTAPNGIAAGLELAMFFVDHHLREAGGQLPPTTDRDRELERLRTELADEQRAYRSRTEQWKRVVHSRQHVEEQRDQLAAALTEVLAVPRIPDSGGETAVHIGPVKCTWVERWRGVLKAASNGSDTGPSVDEVKADDARWWNGEKAGA